MELLTRALQVERGDPREALRLLHRLGRSGEGIDWWVFLVGVACAVAFASAGYLVAAGLDRDRTAVVLAFIVVGLCPMLLLRIRRQEERRGGRLDNRRAAKALLPIAVLAFFSDWLKLLAIFITFVLALVPVVLIFLGASKALAPDPWSLDDLLTMPWFIGLAWALLLYLVLGYEVDVSSDLAFLLPWEGIPEIREGLNVRGGEVLGFLASVALGLLLVGGGSLGLLYEHFWEAVLAAGGIAVLLGLSVAAMEEADEKLAVLRRLAQVRASLRLGRVGAARWLLNDLYGYAVSLKSGRGYFRAGGEPPSLEWLGPAVTVLGDGLLEELLRRKPHLHPAMWGQWFGSSDLGDWEEAPDWERDDWRSLLGDDEWTRSVAAAFSPYGREWLASVENSRQLLQAHLRAARSGCD